MKKIFVIFFLSLILTVSSKSAGLKWNKKYSSGIIKVNGVKFKLPEGEWLLVDKSGWDVSVISYTNAIFVKEENNILKEIYEVGALDTGGKWVSDVNLWIHQNMFGKKNSDGCVKKPEYFLLKFKKTGAHFNCFVIHHDEVEKELWDPDKSNYGIIKPFDSSWVRKWIRDKKIILPSIMLSSRNYFYDKKTLGNYVALRTHSINPEFFNAPETKFMSEKNSEYHRYNIENYPKVKKYMKKFLKQAAIEHQEFEKLVNANENFKLNFNDIGLDDKSSEKNISNDTITQLKALKKLLDDGVITQDEFKKLKDKLLN